MLIMEKAGKYSLAQLFSNYFFITILREIYGSK
jgi:hypothetical protein